MCSVSCDFGRHFDDAVRKIDSCARSFGKAEPLECVRVSRAGISHTQIFSERLIGDVSEDPSVSAELRPRVKLRSPIVTLRGTQLNSLRCSQWEPENCVHRIEARKFYVTRVLSYAIIIHACDFSCVYYFLLVNGKDRVGAVFKKASAYWCALQLQNTNLS